MVQYKSVSGVTGKHSSRLPRGLSYIRLLSCFQTHLGLEHAFPVPRAHHTSLFPSWQIPALPSVCTLLGVATFLESLPSVPEQKDQVLAWLTAHPCPGDPALGSLMESPLRAGSRPPLSALPDSSSAKHSQTRFLEVHVLPA